MTAKQKLESKIYALTQMFRTTPEIENDLWKGIREYAKEKCKEQRILCDKAMQYSESGKMYGENIFGLHDAPQPNFD